MNNSIIVIRPYLSIGTWVFDDASVGLVREPFVAGAPAIISRMVEEQGIVNARDGFALTASAEEFPGYQYSLTWFKGDRAGNWYRLDGTVLEGWLCPALFLYWKEAPKKIFVRLDCLD